MEKSDDNNTKLKLLGTEIKLLSTDDIKRPEHLTGNEDLTIISESVFDSFLITLRKWIWYYEQHIMPKDYAIWIEIENDKLCFRGKRKRRVNILK